MESATNDQVLKIRLTRENKLAKPEQPDGRSNAESSRRQVSAAENLLKKEFGRRFFVLRETRDHTELTLKVAVHLSALNDFRERIQALEIIEEEMPSNSNNPSSEEAAGRAIS